MATASQYKIWLKTTQLPQAQENVSHKGAIGFRFACDWSTNKMMQVLKTYHRTLLLLVHKNANQTRNV